MCRQKSLDADKVVPQKRPRVEDEDRDGPEIKRILQDTENARALPSKALQPEPGTERQKRRGEAEPQGTTVPDKVPDRERGRSRDTAKEGRRAHNSRERYILHYLTIVHAGTSQAPWAIASARNA